MYNTYIANQKFHLIRISVLRDIRKKDVNRDSHIASSPISQSSFFEEVTLFDFGFLTEEASWMHRISKI